MNQKKMKRWLNLIYLQAVRKNKKTSDLGTTSYRYVLAESMNDHGRKATRKHGSSNTRSSPSGIRKTNKVTAPLTETPNQKIPEGRLVGRGLLLPSQVPEGGLILLLVL